MELNEYNGWENRFTWLRMGDAQNARPIAPAGDFLCNQLGDCSAPTGHVDNGERGSSGRH